MTSPDTTPPIEWHSLGNVRLSRIGFDQALALVAGWAGQEPFRLVVTPNADHIMHLQRNAAFREAYARAALSLPDGWPVLWAARQMGLPPLHLVTGSDLVPALCARGAALGWRIFFVGGRTQRELDTCLARVRRLYPGLTIEGYSPPFGFERDAEESARLIEAVRAFGGDLLLMGCGAPKSEIWLAGHGEAIGRGVGLCIGAGLRMLAGLERRAPRWVRHLRLEWFWRLGHDPRRLWHRYLIDDVQIFPLVWRWKRTGKP